MSLPRDSKPPRPIPKAPAGAAASAGRIGKGEKAFDAWLKQGLHKLYDDIASEPVPDSLLKMIEEDRRK
jgi:hypothetical protein